MPARKKAVPPPQAPEKADPKSANTSAKAPVKQKVLVSTKGQNE